MTAQPAEQVRIPDTTMRCHVIMPWRQQCPADALDDQADMPMCAQHLARATRDFVRLTGNKLVPIHPVRD